MAIDPRLPRFATGAPEPVPSYLVRLVNRLEVVLRDLLTPKYYERGTITIANGVDEGTVTPLFPVSSSTVLAISGFSGGTALDSVTAALVVVGTSIHAVRAGTSGDLVVSYVAFNP